MGNHEFCDTYCSHCGAWMRMSLPAPMMALEQLLKIMAKAHASCKPKDGNP